MFINTFKNKKAFLWFHLFEFQIVSTFVCINGNLIVHIFVIFVSFESQTELDLFEFG